ncbi:MAG: type II toxin-antitoxin system HicA family toxin [Bacillota bacterium]
MSQKEKLIKRLLSRPNDFAYREVKSLLSDFGYFEDNRGRTSGSRVAFVHTETKHIIRFHKPHPGNTLKMYQVDELIETLKAQGVI